MNLSEKINAFRKKREWDLIDSEASLAKSIVIESAELLEHFQWTEKTFDKQAVCDELADVLMYSYALCDLLGVTAEEIVEHKMIDVARRYPEKND